MITPDVKIAEKFFIKLKELKSLLLLKSLELNKDMTPLRNGKKRSYIDPIDSYICKEELIGIDEKYCKVMDQCYIEANSQALQKDMQFMKNKQ